MYEVNKMTILLGNECMCVCVCIHSQNYPKVLAKHNKVSLVILICYSIECSVLDIQIQLFPFFKYYMCTSTCPKEQIP